MTCQHNNIIVLEKYQNENEKYDKISLYILIGLPAFGKTFYARQYLKHDNTVIISTDELKREVYDSYAFSQESNATIINIASQRIDSALQS